MTIYIPYWLFLIIISCFGFIVICDITIWINKQWSKRHAAKFRGDSK